MPERSLHNRASIPNTVGAQSGMARPGTTRFDPTPIAPDPAALTSFAAVSSLLWSEREMLDAALFRVTAQRMLLATGRTRWLARATDEVKAALEQVSATEVLRAAEMEALADAMRLPPDTTLAELAAIAPEPWSDLLAEHREALRELAAELSALGTEIRTLLRSGLNAIRETLDGIDRLGATGGLGRGPNAAGGGYDANGSTVRRSRGPILLDETL